MNKRNVGCMVIGWIIPPALMTIVAASGTFGPVKWYGYVIWAGCVLIGGVVYFGYRLRRKS